MKKKVVKIGIIGTFLLIQLLIAQTWAQTWEPTRRLTWNALSSTNPATAIGSSGHIHLAWHAGFVGNQDIYYKKSTDEGVSWSGTKRLTWNAGKSNMSDIAVDSSNNIHVVWCDQTPGNFEVFHKRSTNGGANWTAAKRLTWNSGDSYDPVVAAGPSGHVHVVWYDETPGNFEIYYKRSTDGGVNWSAAKRFTRASGSSYGPNIIADSSGNVHVVWQDDFPGNSEIYYKRSINGGSTWGNIRRLTWTSGGSYNPFIFLDQYNTIHLVWNDNTPGNQEIYYRVSTNGGVNWSTSKRLTWNSGISLSPIISVDLNDNIHIVWADHTTGVSEIYYKRSTNGGVNWGSSKRLTWAYGGSYTSDLTVDSSDNIHVFWANPASSRYEIYYKKGIQ
jgi:hypothetical protein